MVGEKDDGDDKDTGGAVREIEDNGESIVEKDTCVEVMVTPGKVGAVCRQRS